MKIKIIGDYNFFLFQDTVLNFWRFLRGHHRLPIKYKVPSLDYSKRTCSEYIYLSWEEVLENKLFKSNRTDLAIFVMSKINEWMTTTNLAIIRAQKGRGEKDIPRFELDFLKKHRPFFLIEHQDNFETYIVHFDEEFQKLFLLTISFYKTFESMEYEGIAGELTKYFDIASNDIKDEVEQISEHFNGDCSCIHSFEIEEEE